MSRHQYSDDIDDVLQLGRWRGMVKSAIRGKRGQTMLRELRDALDKMPERRLVPRTLQTKDGEACALGCLARAKGKDLSEYTAEDIEDDPYWFNSLLAEMFDIAECLVREIEYENDEGPWKETDEQRWVRIRAWVERHIGPPFAIPAVAG